MAITLTTDGAAVTDAPAPEFPTEIPQAITPPPMVPSFGENPWDVQQREADAAEQEWRTAAINKIDKVALEPDSYFKGKDLGFSKDPEKTKRLALNSAFLEWASDAPVVMGETNIQRRLQRQEVAIKLFEGRGAESEEAFHAEIVKAATARRDTKEIARQIIVSASDDAMLPSGMATGFKAAREKVKTLPGYKPAMDADMMEAWAEQRAAVAEKIAPFKEPLQDVWNEFSGKGNITGAAYTAWATIPPENRRDFLEALALRAKALPDEQRETFWQNMRNMTEQAVGDFARQAAESQQNLALKGTVPTMAGNVRFMSPEESARLGADFTAQRNFAADVRQIFREDYDPLTSAFREGKPGFWEGITYETPGVTATSLSMAVPVVGPAAMAFSMEGAAYESTRAWLLSQGMDDARASEIASGLAPLIAAPQFGLEKVGFWIWSRKLPVFSNLMDNLGNRITNRALRMGAKTVAIGAAETAVEIAQDTTQAVFQSLADDVPGVDWGSIAKEQWANSPEIFFTMLPLSILGAAGGLSRDARNAAFAQSTPLERAAFGITDEASRAIDAAAKLGPASLNTAIENAMASRDPNGPDAVSAVQEMKAKQASQARAAETIQRSGVMPIISQTATGYTVFDGETQEEIASSPDLSGAMRIAESHSAALDHKRAEKVAYLATLLESGAEALDMAADPNAKNSFEVGTLYTESMAEAESPGSIDQFRMQAEAREQVNGGDGEVTRVALGRNISESRGLVRTFTNRLFRGASVLTVVHETGHGMYRRVREAGVLSREETIQFVRGVNRIMGDRTLKRGVLKGEKLALLPDGITDEDITEGMLDEAVQEILEAELLRTRKRGKNEKALRVSSGIISRNLLALSRLAPNATRKFRALIEAARGVLGLTAARALRMKQAARAGEFDTAGHEAFLTKLTGRDWQADYDGTVRDEYASITGQAVDQVTENAPFSIGTQRRGEDIEETDYADPQRVQPRNSIESPKQVSSVAKLYIDNENWVGRPLLAFENGNNSYEAVTGSHRLAGALEAELEYIPLVVIDLNELDEWWTENPSNIVIDAYGFANNTREEDQLAALQEAKADGFEADWLDRSIELLKLEDDSNFLDRKERASFSIAPSRMVEALEINAAARIKDPEVKTKIFQNLISRVSRLKRDRDEIKMAFGKEYERKAIAEPRGSGVIRKDYALRKEAAREKLEQESAVQAPEVIKAEADRIEAIRTEELQEQVYARHEGILSNPDLVKLKEWPVHAHLADPSTPLRGRLKTKSAAMREVWFSDKTGDFDGADGVPRSNFGGSLMPDQAAQELYEAGLIKAPTADALWEALKKEAAQIPKFKEALKAAKADMSAAKEQAKAESETWARGERIKRQELEEAIQAAVAEIDGDMQAALKEEADNYSPRERLLRTLAMWDAMLSVLPAEVRGKVGGYVQLAKLASDEARMKFLEDGLEKIETAMDEFLGKEYRKMLDKLVDDAAPKKDKAGKKRKGHLGAEGHRFFTHVRAVLDMNEDTLTARLAKVDEKLMEETDPEILADLSEEWQILRTFGNFDEKAVLEKHDALELAKKVFKDGKNLWRTLEETRIAAVRAAAGTAKVEAGDGDVRDIQKAKADGKTTVAALTEKHWNLRSFREVLDLAFGEDSATAQRFGNGTRKAFAARTKAMIQLQRRWKDAMEKATGKKGRAARQVVYDMQDIQSIDELVSPEIFEEIKIPIDTFFDAEKKSSLGLSKEEAERLTEQFENLPENSQRKYLTLERQVKTGEGASRMVKFTEAEAIHLSMLWAQTEYKAAMRKHGFGADFQAAIESKLSPAAKELRQWLADYYRDEFPSIAGLYRRMYGVDLRQTENYAPGTFWQTGTNETPVDPSAGVVTGGSFKQGMGSGGDFAQGFLRQRKQHKAVPRIKNAFDLFFSHANQTEHWKAMAELSREMHGVFGNPSVKIAMEARSPAAANALREWLNAIDGNGVSMSPSGKLMKYLLKSQAYMAMAWKASTAAKNLIGAAVNQAYGMPLHEYVKGMAKLVGGRLEFGEILKSDAIQNKLNGGYAPEVRAAVSQALNGKPTWRGDMLIQGLQIHGKADAFGNAIGATIAYDYHYRKGLDAGMSETQARTVAMELTQDAITRFSQPAEIIDRSLFELNLGTFGKLVFLFRSEARQKSSLYLTALGHTVTGKATRKDLRVLFISHLVVAPLMQMVGAALRDAMDPDDDEWLDDKYWNPRDFLIAAMTGPLSGIPLLADIFSGFTGNNSPLGNYVRGGKSLWDLFAEEPRGDEVDWYQSKINQVLQAVGAFPGVAGNVIKQVIGTAENTKNLNQ